MSTRIRPDIQTAVIFINIRLKKTDKYDRENLKCVLMHYTYNIG